MTNVTLADDALPDPDQGRLLKDSIRQQSLSIRDRRLAQKQDIPSSQVMDELGLHDRRSHRPPPRDL